MPRIGDVARIRGDSDDKDERMLSLDVPLIDNVRLVHSDMRRLAMAVGHPSSFQSKRGYRATLSMAQVIRRRSGMSPEDNARLGRLVGQVLRKSGAAVCVHRPHRGSRDVPVWFVADELPENILVIVNWITANSGAVPGGLTDFERDFLSYEERKLLPEQVGEDRQPGEVTVKKTEPKTGRRSSPKLTDAQRQARVESLKPHQDRLHAEHEKFVEELYEFIKGLDVPVAGSELHVAMNHALGTSWHNSTCRQALTELAEAGRVISRPETFDERVVRAGGRQPRGKGVTLYTSADRGEVPVRTKLPAGVKPLPGAAEWAELESEGRRSLEERIIKLLDTPYRADAGGVYPPRTLGRLALALNEDKETVLGVLKRLKSRGLVYQNDHSAQWHASSRRRGAKRPRRSRAEAEALAADVVKDLQAGMARQPEAEPTVEATHDAEPQPQPKPTQGIKELGDVLDAGFRRLAEELAEVWPTETETGPDPKLSAEVDALRKENAKLREANNHLRAALANLT